MNIDHSNNQATLNIMSHLYETTSNLTTAQIISEMRVAVERISFAGLAKKQLQSTPEFEAELIGLFEGEISQDMMQFISWLASMNALSVMADKVGRLFVDYCIKYYREIPEIRFISAVELPTESHLMIADMLRSIHSAPTRIIYEVSPSIIAGFIIKEGEQVVDRSLRSHMSHSIRDFMLKSYDQGLVHG